MTVKELIDKLQGADPEAVVLFRDLDRWCWREVTAVGQGEGVCFPGFNPEWHREREDGPDNKLPDPPQPVLFLTYDE